MDLETGNSTSEPKLIRESASGVAEGSHIFKRGKYYYLFTAEGGTESGHCEWVCRSEVSPFGPWELGPNNPLWRNGVQDEVQNTGHADLVEDERGQWWAVLLGVRPVKRDGVWEESVFGEFLSDLRVGALVVDEAVQVEKRSWCQSHGSTIGQCLMVERRYRCRRMARGSIPSNILLRGKATFRTPSCNWVGIGRVSVKANLLFHCQANKTDTPVKSDYSLTERPGYLRLHGGPYNLSAPACPTLFLRKQTHRHCTWETRLTFRPTSPQTEAGTTVWWNYFTYSSIGIRLSPTKMDGTRIVRFRPAEGQTIDVELTDAASDVVFLITCGDAYRFGFKEVQGNEDLGGVNWIGEVKNRTMTEAPLSVGAPFTGMMLGLYAFGELQRCLVPADFAYAEFR